MRASSSACSPSPPMARLWLCCAYDHIWQELYATEKAWLPAVLEPVQFTPPPHTILQLLSTPFTTPHHPLTRCVRPT